MLKTNKTRRRVPDVPARGVRVQLAAMVGLLRCFVAAPVELHSSQRIPLRANDRQVAKKVPRARGLTSRAARLMRLLLVALRLVVAVTAVQITGIPHIVADAVAVVQGNPKHEESPSDEHERECPPGCPSCHCAHAMSALPLLVPTMMPGPRNAIDVGAPPPEAHAPPRQDPASVYRPPRQLCV